MNFNPLLTIKRGECKNATINDVLRGLMLSITSIILLIFIAISYVKWELDWDNTEYRILLVFVIGWIWAVVTTPLSTDKLK